MKRHTLRMQCIRMRSMPIANWIKLSASDLHANRSQFALGQASWFEWRSNRSSLTRLFAKADDFWSQFLKSGNFDNFRNIHV